MKKKFLSGFLSIILGLHIILCPAFTFASAPPEIIPNSNNSFVFPSLKDGVSTLSRMSVPQLNSYISSVAQRDMAVAASTSSSNDTAATIIDVRLALYAAGLIAQKVGFPCAGRILEHSALNIDYTESNGAIARAIQNSPSYEAWKSTSNDSITFEIASDGLDLFLALHWVSVNVTGSPSSSRIRIIDTFNFDPKFFKQPSIINAINDIGWLSQKVYLLSEIEIQIDIVS